MKSNHVIQRPLVTEKSTLAREERNVVTFAVDPRANKHDDPPRRRGALLGEGARRSHDAHAAQEAPRGQVHRAASRRGRRRSCGWPRASRSSSSRECDRMPVRATSPRRPGRRDMASRISPSSRRSAPSASLIEGVRKQLGRPQHAAARHDVPPRRRPQAAATATSTSSATSSASRRRSRRSSTTRTAPRASRCCTTPTARSATSWRRIGLNVGDTRDDRRRRRDQARQHAAAREDPARHGRAQHRAEAGQGRPAGALRRHRRAADGPRGQATPARMPSGEMRMVHVACLATIGQVGNAEHENVASARPVARAGWASGRTCAASR